LKNNKQGSDWIDEAVAKFGAKRFSDIDPFKDGTWCSLGVPTFDKEMDFIGFPKGIVEITGPSASGKTSMAYQILGKAQEQFDNAKIVIFSAENRDNGKLAKGVGLDLSDVTVLYPETTEDMKNMAIGMVNLLNEQAQRAGKEPPKMVFLLDSMGQLFSESEAKKIESNAENGEAKAQNPGASAKANNEMLRAIKVLSQKNDLTLIVINRKYSKIGFNAKGTTSAGGTGITYLSTVRLDLRKVKDIKVSAFDWPIGQEVEVKIIKSDFGRPRHKFIVELMFGYGYNLSNDCIRMGMDMGLLEKYSYGFKSTDPETKVAWKNKKEFIQLLESQDQGLKAITRKITEAVHANIMDKNNSSNE